MAVWEYNQINDIRYERGNFMNTGKTQYILQTTNDIFEYTGDDSIIVNVNYPQLFEEDEEDAVTKTSSSNVATSSNSGSVPAAGNIWNIPSNTVASGTNANTLVNTGTISVKPKSFEDVVVCWIPTNNSTYHYLSLDNHKTISTLELIHFLDLQQKALFASQLAHKFDIDSYINKHNLSKFVVDTNMMLFSSLSKFFPDSTLIQQL